MKILHTCHTYWPHTDGVSIATQRLSEGLAARGHEVIVATGPADAGSADKHCGVEIRRFDLGGNEVWGYSGDVDAYQHFIRSWDGDVMLNYAAQICTTDLVFPLLDDLACRKVLVPCGYSHLFNSAFAAYFGKLPHWLAKYDKLVYLSASYRDKAFGDRNGLAEFAVIGNGASEEEFSDPVQGFRTAYGVSENRMILCVSNWTGAKGQDVVLRAVIGARVRDTALVFMSSGDYVRGAHHVMTRPGFAYGSRRRWHGLALRLSGERAIASVQRPVRYASQAVTVYPLLDVPRELTVAAYHEADLFVMGSQVECAPLVIYEAMASRTPFVSTDVGCVAELPGGVVVHSVHEMSEWIGRLICKGGEWRALAEEGRRAWERDYGWEGIVDAYERLYSDLLARPRASER